MNAPALDARLKTVADLYPHCPLGADIGSDHAHLPCYLLKNNICDRMIVSDISPFSRQKAEALMKLHGFENRAECIEANGLAAIKGRNVQCVSITGMGGKLIAHLLQTGAAQLNNAALILSAHTDTPIVRSAVQNIGYSIITEAVTFARGRFYLIFSCQPGVMNYTQKQLYLGKSSLRRSEDATLWHKYFKWRQDVVACEKGHQQQLQWIKEEMSR